MKIKEIHNSKLAKLLGVGGVTLYPYIFYVNVPENSVRYHEFCHVLQIRKDGVLYFYTRYLLEYLWGRVRGKSHDLSYRSISYEREAYLEQERFLSAGRRIELLLERVQALAETKKA
jgi:hypothetical protein